MFALIALFLVWIDVKFAGHKYNSEQFNTAGRSVKAGLIGVDVVSHFTWASILLGCVELSYLNGVSNSMWYVFATMASCLQFVLLSQILADDAKVFYSRCPGSACE